MVGTDAEGADGGPLHRLRRSSLYRGELVPSAAIEEFVPFAEGEPHWSLAGAEKPAMLIEYEERQARRAAAAETEGDAGAAAAAGRRRRPTPLSRAKAAAIYGI